MQIDHFNVDVKDKILIVTSKKNVTQDDLKEMHSIMETSTRHKYACGIYRDLIGYYDGYDFINKISIYCGVMNEKEAITRVKNYIKAQS